MRRSAAFAALLAALVWPAGALADPPAVSVTATPASGPAPLSVTLAATGDPATYHWTLGDGTSADGAIVHHVFPSGAHTALVTATAADGETSTAQVTVTGTAVSLNAPAAANYAARGVFAGRISPARAGVRVTITAAGRRVGVAATTAGGVFHTRIAVLRPGPYRAHSQGADSPARTVLVHSTIDASITGTALVGSKLQVQATARPLTAGRLRVRVERSGTQTFDRMYRGPASLQLGTSGAAAYVVRVTLVPNHGYTGHGRVLRSTVYVPALGLGSHGPSVLALEQQLYRLHYALRTVDSSFDDDTRDAVYAFQKVYGLARTGRVDATFWRLLAHATVPRARYACDHVEVDKTRQVLFVVRNGQVVLITHVSTGATGNTPLGTWHVYGKTPGWLPDGMFDSSFFLRGFAVHGYPEVPPYPASHGCVRVPVWLAPRLYGLIPTGSEVVIYN
jgi:PKD repeat protein